MTPSELAALREAVKGHTPGPWEIARYTNYEGYSIWGAEIGCLAERWYATRLSAEQNMEMGANAALIAAAPALLAHIDADRWIPVSEGLPERGVSVLVTMNTGLVDTSHIAKGGEGWRFLGQTLRMDWVLAWRPLPEPYRGGVEPAPPAVCVWERVSPGVYREGCGWKATHEEDYDTDDDLPKTCQTCGKPIEVSP